MKNKILRMFEFPHCNGLSEEKRNPRTFSGNFQTISYEF
ncbi:hypothetical protein LEP1GSC060_3876 [Leptospira weilii serovar Ranarum str. ICFT]|uniref:Uncharacterized protein n=1 Tax=Leptospira weilii serovar Ranarum str. ICFT TaxID=1218598 RepID=N1WRY3_9LEPT|nr:hypothetical protein LEP1GSC060_3876 [Leptospira weilii serovar Ranarum str. ICFT]